MLEYALSGGQPAAGKKGVPKSRTLEGDDMVQDPNCKVYVPVSRSVERRVGGEIYHFCSEECAKSYLKRVNQ